MTLTSNDVRNRLKNLDEISLLEVLEITSEDIVDRFDDKIEEKIDYLTEDLGDEKNASDE
jgi:hypothetical protein